MKTKFATPGETRQEREEFWLDRIKEARSYPGGISKFCKDSGIGKEIYYSWFRQLKDRVADWQTPLDTSAKRRKNPPKVKSSRIAAAHRPTAEWRALVVQCDKSRLSRAAFAKSVGIHKVTFCRWYRRIKSKEKGTALTKPEPMKNRRASKSAFVPVQLVDSKTQLDNRSSTAKHNTSSVDIVLANNRTIRVNAGCSPELLRMVVTALEAF